jgi:orotidine-5'-phosphate decarboxylase
MAELTGKERLIVALDVPTRADALRIVEDLEGVAQFFKIGWELFIAGEAPALLDDLRGKRIFVDLKIPADIGNTIARLVAVCVDRGVKFLTLSDSRTLAVTVRAAIAGRGSAADPKLLAVPFLSSLDASDLRSASGTDETDLDRYILARSREALGAGCDGLIASGEAIRTIRSEFASAIIVSPGIRLEGSPVQDHKRVATPAQAIRMGADYLVVGRPIRDTPSPRGAAQRIVDEIDRALVERQRLS